MSSVLADTSLATSGLGSVSGVVTFSSVDGPGNRLVVFLQGCNFDCVACHNPQTIPVFGTDAGHERTQMHVSDLLARIRTAAAFLSGITVSGGEATLQAAFVRELFSAMKADPQLARLTCFIDSNGACDPATWDLLAPVTDGAMIDLKCLDPDIHLQMTGQPNDAVLASIRQLQAKGLLYEVRLLLLDGVNDDAALLRRTAEWLAEIDPAMRVKIIGFRRHGARPHTPELVEPTHDALLAAAELLHEIAPFDICVI
jgi:pyruvate formate lyase activating enzyme